MTLNDFFGNLDHVSRHMNTAGGLWQLAVLSGGFGVAWLLARAARDRVPDNLAPGRWKVAAGGFNRLAFPVIALCLVWIGKIVLARLYTVSLLNIALPLLASFAAIRAIVYLIRHLIPPSPTLKASERIIAYVMWALVALYLTGLLGEVEAAMNDIAFTVGRQRITLFMILTGLFTIAITVLVAVMLSRMIEERIMRAETINLSLRLVFAKLVQALAIFVAVLVALPLVGIDVTVLSVFGGALGVGLGFGLQKVASNYVSGFIILIERSIRVGDFVTVDNRQGKVTSINGRYTVVSSLDGAEALIPNETLITSTVINHTFRNGLVLVKMPVTVAYESDLDEVNRILLAAAGAQPRVLAEPGAAVQIRNLGESGIELDLLFWIADPDLGQGALKSDIYRSTWTGFKRAGIDLPFPQQVVHLKTANTPELDLNAR